MEPNCYHIDLRQGISPFAPGDVVDYVGGCGYGYSLDYKSQYDQDRTEGEVIRCFNSRIGANPSDWICYVHWPKIAARGRGTLSYRTRVLAKNLRLSRARVQCVQAAKFRPVAMRADEV
jgi:hypothetical protein